MIRVLEEQAQKQANIVLVTADMGFSVFEKFAEEYPQRFFNVGIAEGTMIGFAAGLAMQGLLPVVYSISPFATMRCFEQIRVDLCYQRLPVVIVGVGGGFSYGSLGSTHHSIEDVAIMRALPNMTVYAPADPIEAEFCLLSALKSDGPAYVRLARNNEPVLHDANIDSLEDVIHVCPGDDIAILTYGPVLAQAIEARQKLSSNGINVAVYSIPVLKPLDKESLTRVLRTYNKVFILEEHNVIGGLGSAVSQIAVSTLSRPELPDIRFIAVPDSYPDQYGNHSFLLTYYGLDTDGIVSEIIRELEAASRSQP